MRNAGDERRKHSPGAPVSFKELDGPGSRVADWLEILPSPAPQKFTTFNTFNTFNTFELFRLCSVYPLAQRTGRGGQGGEGVMRSA
jgi:hypothetical protein